MAKMTNKELNEAIFVTLGYPVFMWLYYKLAKKWDLKEKDKSTMVIKAYVSIMLVLPIATFVLVVLTCLYSALFGGVTR
jgi:hypothetical protein